MPCPVRTCVKRYVRTVAIVALPIPPRDRAGAPFAAPRFGAAAEFRPENGNDRLIKKRNEFISHTLSFIKMTLRL